MHHTQSTQFSQLDYSNHPNNYDLVKVVGEKDKNRKLVTTSKFKKGEVIAKIDPYSRTKNPDFLTVQINSEEHIMDLLLEAMNHSCSPTTFVDTEKMVILADKDLLPGDELTFFYPSTEWKMDRPFKCQCKSPNCIGFVAGAKELAMNQMVCFKLNNHIKRLTGKMCEN